MLRNAVPIIVPPLAAKYVFPAGPASRSSSTSRRSSRLFRTWGFARQASPSGHRWAPEALRGGAGSSGGEARRGGRRASARPRSWPHGRKPTLVLPRTSPRLRSHEDPSLQAVRSISCSEISGAAEQTGVSCRCSTVKETLKIRKQSRASACREPNAHFDFTRVPPSVVCTDSDLANLVRIATQSSYLLETPRPVAR